MCNNFKCTNLWQKRIGLKIIYIKRKSYRFVFMMHSNCWCRMVISKGVPVMCAIRFGLQYSLTIWSIFSFSSIWNLQIIDVWKFALVHGGHLSFTAWHKFAFLHDTPAVQNSLTCINLANIKCVPTLAWCWLKWNTYCSKTMQTKKSVVERRILS